MSQPRYSINYQRPQSLYSIDVNGSSRSINSLIAASSASHVTPRSESVADLYQITNAIGKPERHHPASGRKLNYLDSHVFYKHTEDISCQNIYNDDNRFASMSAATTAPDFGTKHQKLTPYQQQRREAQKLPHIYENQNPQLSRANSKISSRSVHRNIATQPNVAFNIHNNSTRGNKRPISMVDTTHRSNLLCHSVTLNDIAASKNIRLQRYNSTLSSADIPKNRHLKTSFTVPSESRKQFNFNPLINNNNSHNHNRTLRAPLNPVLPNKSLEVSNVVAKPERPNVQTAEKPSNFVPLKKQSFEVESLTKNKLEKEPSKNRFGSFLNRVFSFKGSKSNVKAREFQDVKNVNEAKAIKEPKIVKEPKFSTTEELAKNQEFVKNQEYVEDQKNAVFLKTSPNVDTVKEDLKPDSPSNYTLLEESEFSKENLNNDQILLDVDLVFDNLLLMSEPITAENHLSQQLKNTTLTESQSPAIKLQELTDKVEFVLPPRSKLRPYKPKKVSNTTIDHYLENNSSQGEDIFDRLGKEWGNVYFDENKNSFPFQSNYTPASSIQTSNENAVAKSFRFADEVRVCDTWSPDEYDRADANFRTNHYRVVKSQDPYYISNIKLELNNYKRHEMVVHQYSAQYTQFFV